MKKVTNSILALCAVFMFTVGTSYASFPVKSDSKKQEVKEQVSSVDAPAVSESTVKASEKASTKVESANANDLKKSTAIDDEKLITLLLWFFLGGLAAHRWYRGKPVGWNILFILTGGGCFVWALVDLINIITDKF